MGRSMWFVSNGPGPPWKFPITAYPPTQVEVADKAQRSFPDGRSAGWHKMALITPTRSRKLTQKRQTTINHWQRTLIQKNGGEWMEPLTEEVKAWIEVLASSVVLLTVLSDTAAKLDNTMAGKGRW